MSVMSVMCLCVLCVVCLCVHHVTAFVKQGEGGAEGLPAKQGLAPPCGGIPSVDHVANSE